METGSDPSVPSHNPRDSGWCWDQEAASLLRQLVSSCCRWFLMELPLSADLLTCFKIDYSANRRTPDPSPSENAWLRDEIWCAWAEIIQRHTVCLKTSVMGGGEGESKQRQQLLCATSVSENILRWNTSMWTNRSETNPVILIYCFFPL